MLKFTLAPKSEQETAFIQDIISNLKSLNISNIDNINKLEQAVHQVRTIINQAWAKNAKKLKISKHSKQWWSNKCKWSLENYRASKSLENWKKFKITVKNVKRSYFDDKIQEIVNKSRGPWELMNWIKQRKLRAIEAINYDGQLYLTLDSLWNALHKSFNSAQNRQVDLNILNKIKCKPPQKWSPFSKSEFLSVINKCKDSLAPGPDKLLWCHLKSIIQNNDCLANIINITDSCITLGYWPNYFKISTTIVIPKPNKSSYD